MVSIFEYTDYRDYLKDLISEKKQKQKSFSIRLLSMKAGIKSPGFLSMVLNNKRNITADLAVRISQALGLNKKDEKYFLLMVEYTHASRLESKHEILQSMLSLARSNSVCSLAPEQFEFYDKWYYSVIRELVEVTEINDDNCEQIAGKLDPQIRPRDIRQALQILTRLKLIYKDRNGRYVRKDTLITCGDNIRSVAINKFQSTMIQLAENALERVSRESRDYSTLTLSIDRDTFAQIREKCNLFRKELLNIAGNVAVPDRVVQINIQCFPVTKIESESSGSGSEKRECSVAGVVS